MAKRATIKNAAPAAKPATADAFVGGTAGRAEVKRLTIDLPPDTHRRFKSLAGLEGHSMVDLVREWIDEYVARAPEMVPGLQRRPR